MDRSAMQCHGCGSTNVEFDPQKRILICMQCGKKEYYSRATLNANGKVVYAKQNAINFFREKHYETAKDYAQDVLNIFIDNAPALYIMAYYDDHTLGKIGAMSRFFEKVRNVPLEYEETMDLMTLFLAAPYPLIDLETAVIETIAKNMQSQEDADKLCGFIDQICPFFISRWPSMGYLKQEKIEMYCELAEHCGIPKTCLALIKAIQTNPDSPYARNAFFLKQKTKFFYDNFVTQIGRVINSMKNDPVKSKFLTVYEQRKRQYELDANK